ncbi:MAG: tetratricopeptide repeat protein [Cytophagales bacterium]|nr:tetratricopeptide repeat protein [Bernardetiaceae bacterium]MDW8210358.1 tetratricopeptide repeat protein [Cytophagales bacterium]
MRWHQGLAGGVAVLAIISLSVLPKSVVETDLKTMQASSPSQMPIDEKVIEMHSATLSQEQKTKLNKWREEFLKSSDKDRQRVLLDSLAMLYQSVNQLDSIAYYTEIAAKKHPSASTYMMAADAWYQAMGFAPSAEKSKQLAEKARSYYQQVLEIDPARLDAKVKMGMTFLYSENPMQGIALIRQVLEEDPENQLALLNLGILSMQSGQYQKAIARFKQLLALDPENVKAQFYLAVSLAESGEKQEAIQWFKAVQKADQDPAVQAAIAEYLQKLEK